MWSSCSAGSASTDLHLRCPSHVRVYFAQERPVDLIDTLVTIHLSQLVLLSVVVEHLSDMTREDDQPPAHSLSGIIRTSVEPTSIHITSISHLRWTKCDMVGMLIRLTEHSACKSL